MTREEAQRIVDDVLDRFHAHPPIVSRFYKGPKFDEFLCKMQKQDRDEFLIAWNVVALQKRLDGPREYHARAARAQRERRGALSGSQ